MVKHTTTKDKSKTNKDSTQEHTYKKTHVNKPRNESRFNYKKTINNPTLKKYLFNEKLLILILILIPIIISTHYRMAPSDLAVTEQWAWDSYESQLRAQVSQQISAQYPNLPQAQKDQFINQQLQELLAQQKDAIEPQIKQTADYFKSRMQDENGNTYLLAIDPYLWLTQAENYVENGHPGDTKTAEGVPDLARRNGREPDVTRFNLHPWLGAQIYKVVSVFNSNFTLQRSMFILPVIIIALSIIPAFFLGRKIGGNLSGFLAGLLVALNTSLLGRTPAGFSDTDAYIILFPLLIVWTFIEALDAKNTIVKYSWLAGASFATILFSFTWGVWWHIVGIVLAVAFVHFIQTIIRERQIFKTIDLKKILKTKSVQTIGVVIAFLVAILLLNQLFLLAYKLPITAQSNFLYPLKQIFIDPLNALAIKSVASTDVWPNVLTTVAELNSGSWNQIISSLGGKLFFIFGIIGVLLTFFKTNEKGFFEIRYIALLAIWFIGLASASLISARFIALLAAPFAIAFGSGFGILFSQGSKYVTKNFQIHHLIPKILIIVVLVFLLSNSFVKAGQVAQSEVPSMTDEWYNSLVEIDNDTDNGLITSWWDFGHWFVNIAQQRVTFDGGGQGKRIYWVGKSLMTSDVQENKDILRMLNCGQEEGYKRIFESQPDSYTATNIITTITYQSREQAAETLLNSGIPLDKIDYILEKTHCSNEELYDQYYIVSEDMIGKAGVWAHFGGWNFTRAKIYNIAKRTDFEQGVEEIKALGIEQSQAEKLYFDAISLTDSRSVDTWISPWPSYVTPAPRSCTVINSTLNCVIRQGLGTQQGQQIILDTVTLDVNKPNKANVIISVVSNNQIVGSETIKPRITSLDNGEQIVSITNNDATTFPYEVLFVETNGQYQVIIADPALAKSVFTMLYYFDGKYMDGYTKISDRTTFTGQDILVYKVDLDN